MRNPIFKSERRKMQEETREEQYLEEVVSPEVQVVRMEKGDLAYWADVSLITERVRVAAQVRIAHLAKTGRRSLDTEAFLEVAKKAEAFADARLAAYVVSHPTWSWASRILGVGKENYPKVIGLIESFARYYDVGDPKIPSFVQRSPEQYQKVEAGEVVDKVGIWVEGIERLATPSKLWKYAGINVEEGHAPKRSAGKKLGFNSQLRMALFRLATSFNRARGKWYGRYEEARQEIVSRKEAEGVKIVPTPQERMCLNCNIEVKAKRTKFCPQCGEKLTLKEEPPGFLFLGHLHAMALREMMKDFLVCLWIVWRQELGLPVTQPYKVEYLGHKAIDPWEMIDR